jgi:hypothetical protein
MSETPRHFEGPPELLWANKNERDINDRRGMPGGKSPADNLTKQYGERGTGWDLSKQAYMDENLIKDAEHAPEFGLATEAFMNALRHGRYELDDGTDMRGKVQRYVREADTVDVVVYPDGKAHAAKNEQK